MHKLRERYFNRTFFSWLLSYFIIFSIPIFFSLVLHTYSSRLIESEIKQVETEAIGQMKYFCDGIVSSVQNIAEQISNNQNVKLFTWSNASTTDDKLNIKKTFEYLQVSASLETSIDGIYLFSYENEYVISSKHGSNHESARTFDYQDFFGINKKEFWQLIDQVEDSTLVFKDQNGKPILCYYRVLLSKDARKADGFLLITYSFQDSVFSTHTDNRLGGIILADGDYIRIKGDKGINQETAHILKDLNEFSNTDINGKSYLMVKKKSDIKNWEYIFGTQKDVVFHDLEKSRMVYAVFLLASILVCLIIAILLARRNYNPVLQLVEKIQRYRLDDTVDKDWMFAYLERSFQNLEKERFSLAKQLDYEKSVLVNNVFNRIIKGYYKNTTEVENALEQYEITFKDSSVFMVFWSVDDYSNLFFEEKSSLEANILDLVKFLIKNVGSECLNREFSEVYAVECDYMVVFVVQVSPEKDSAVVMETTLRLNQEIQEVLHEKFGLLLSSFISKIHKNVSELNLCYMECLTNMGMDKKVELEDQQSETLERLKRNIDEERYDHAVQDYTLIAAQIKKDARHPYEEKLQMYDLLAKMQRSLMNNPKLESFNEKGGLGQLLNIPDTEKLRTETVKVLLSLEDFKTDSDVKMKNRANEIRQYLDHHIYHPDLSVSSIAQVFGLTENYISKLMKSELNMSITAYINQKRIEYIKYLIDNTQESIVDISTKAGFYSYRTMIRNFRQYEGVTPTEYRERKGNQ